MKTIIFANALKQSKVMKKEFSIFVVAACCFLMSCSQGPRTTETSKNGAVIEFETTEHDFGTIPQGGDGTFVFVFKNKGNEPLILNNVRSSCGCTIPEWPKEPLKKGDKGKIRVSYNTRITGNFTKSITVYSNSTGAPVVLNIKGKVEAAGK
jgi:hypothetical protein